LALCQVAAGVQPRNKAETYVVETAEQLRAVLDTPHACLVFVEAVMYMDRIDSPSS
jgi:hypothetical protein